MNTQNSTAEQQAPSADYPTFDEIETFEGLAKKSDGKLSKWAIEWDYRFRKDKGLEEAFIKRGNRKYVHVPTYMRIAFGNRG